ncbi:MAG: reverse transcriptase family protein [bacterium]|nr:reverse transcriptase family protein [bacterium]
MNKNILRDVMLQLPENMIGGVPGRSVASNAKPHIDQEMVLGLDIRDCFPKINHSTIHLIWSKWFGFDANSARLLTQLTTLHRHLPQGSPTSLALCNLSLLPLYEDIDNYTSKAGLNFSMFVDDISVSGEKEPVQESIDTLIKIIQKHGYPVRHSKIRKMPRHTPQIVTGLLTNKKLAVSKTMIRMIRQGIIKLAKKEEPLFSKQVIMSKIGYVKGVSPEKGRALEDFANMLLSKQISVKSERSKRGEIVSCNGKNCLALVSKKLLPVLSV